MGGIPLVFSSLCVYRIFHEINHPAITSGLLLYIIYPNYYLDMILLLYYKYMYIYIYYQWFGNTITIYIYIYIYIYTIYTYIYILYIYKCTIQQPPWFGKHQLIEPGPFGRSGSKSRPPKVGPGCDLRGSDGTSPRAAWNPWGNPRKTFYCYDGYPPVS